MEPPEPASPRSAGRPSVLVIGAARSGTTALVTELATHTDLYAGAPKEPHFLALGHRAPLAFTGPGDDVTINAKAVLRADAWGAMYPAPGGIDGSVSSLYYAPDAVAAIARHCPDAALIAILRRPAQRALSAHSYQTGKGWETLSFEAALAAEAERIEAGWHHIWHYRRMGHYAEQLEVFADAFGATRVLVLDHAEFEQDPAGVLRRCATHIGIDPEGFAMRNRRVNEGSVRARPLVLAERTLRHSRVGSAVVRAVLPRAARDRIRRVGRRDVTLTAATRRELDQYFAADTARLAGLLGDRAPAWARSA